MPIPACTNAMYAESHFESDREQVQTLILQAGDFFGGKQTGSWFDLVLTREIEKGRFVYPGTFDCVHAWAYLPHLARTFVRLAEQAHRCDRFERFCFEGHSVTARQMHRAVNRARSQPQQTQISLVYASPTR
jgi:hypothetical protein